jgi:two-component system cell cycle response regulator DivK
MQNDMNNAKAGNPKKSFYAWQGKMILVVEDEDHNYTYIYEILKRTRISMIRAVTGKDAIRLFKENKIDLVLMDIKLPDIDGLSVTMEIKRLNVEVPVIAQTAYAMAVERERCLQAGCDDYLSKPYDPEKLLNIVQKYLL